MKAASVQLEVLLARSAPRAVVFRRGPSKSTLLVAWNLADDSFEKGQWLTNRRVRVEWSDISPSGRHLIYFVQSYRRQDEHGTWTAICKPPYFTALALWPQGDSWAGGGAFESNSRIRLAHPVERAELAEGFAIPKSMTVTPGCYGGHVERECRNGWEVIEKIKMRDSYGHRILLGKRMPGASPKITQELRQRATGGYELVTSERTHDLSDCSWADWDHNCDLLFARGGKLFRAKRSAKTWQVDPSAARELVDLTSEHFQECAAPADYGW